MAAQLGKPFESLSINPIRDGVFVSSPVIARNTLFLRSGRERLCIGENREVSSGRSGKRA